MTMASDQLLVRAVRATFERRRRKAPLAVELPTGLKSEFAADPETHNASGG
jgi:hypothetical protein